MAIRAMQNVVKEFPDAQLLLAGNGPEKENLKQEIVNCNLENNVKLLGYCTCLEKYQRVADVLVSCSKREGLPLNLVEAMLTENPVVVSVNRGHRELVQDGENGYLVAVDDSETMSERVIKLLKDDVNRIHMGQNARAYAKQYGVKSVQQELKQIYEV